MKNKLKNLSHLMSVMIRRFKNHPPPPVAQNSGSNPSFPQNETPVVQNQNVDAPAVQINIPQPLSSFDHLEVPQYEAETSAGVDKEMKEKVEELERPLE